MLSGRSAWSAFFIPYGLVCMGVSISYVVFLFILSEDE